jgi:hypothetical protein
MTQRKDVVRWGRMDGHVLVAFLEQISPVSACFPLEEFVFLPVLTGNIDIPKGEKNQVPSDIFRVS